MKGTARSWYIQEKGWIVPIAKGQAESIVKYHRTRAQNYIVYPFPFVENSKRCRKVDLFMTKRIQKSLFVLVCLSASFLVALPCHGAEKEIAGPSIKAANVPHKNHTVKALADRVRARVDSEPLRFPNQHWVRGAYYAGLMAMYESTLDRAYLDDCMEWGKNVSWQIKEQGGGPYESGAYPLVCGQIWYGCYLAENDEMMMRPTLAFLEDPTVENPVSAPGKWYLENTGHRFVDGLFTAPPLLAMLYQMTGDDKYVDWMNACFWDVHKEIFDRDAGLFYRDARSKPRKTKNGKKVLWSRGNGWAFGGLTRILKYLPVEHPSYPKYKSLYLQMAESLAKRQQADGFWRSNLDDPEQYPMKESSGTGFFCYGIAWGINNGILDRERFLPVIKKAWTALASIVNEDGQVGWSQPSGGGPGKVVEPDTSKFGTGIFLLAASEMFLLKQNKAVAKPKR
jgi:rhamnogalacturonyl hydrolase YesR